MFTYPIIQENRYSGEVDLALGSDGNRVARKWLGT